MTAGVPAMDSDRINQLLGDLGRNLSAGDLAGVSNCFEIPVVFLSDDGATILTDLEQLKTLFAQASQWYQSRGLVSTKPELERIDLLSEKLAAVDVRWPAFDASGQEKFSERSHYILTLPKDGGVRIRVALTRTK
jgi:hypothetical protein